MKVISLRWKLLIYFAISAFIPVLLLGLSSYLQSSHFVQAQFGRYGEHAVEQMRILMDERFQQMNLVAASVIAYLADPQTAPLTGQDPVSYAELEREREIGQVLNMLNHSFPSIISTNIITQSGKIYGSNLLQYENLINSDWWQSMNTLTKRRYWSSFHDIDYYNPYSISPGTAISLVIPLDEKYNVPADSWLLVDVRAEPILEIFRSFEEDTGASLTITDAFDRIVYQTGSGRVPQDDDIVWTTQLKTTGWKIRANLPYAVFNRSSSVILQNTAFFAALSFILSLLAAIVFASLVSRRLKRLNQSMRDFGLGRMDTKIEVSAADEIGQLEKRFNTMSEQIHMLIQDIERKEQAKKEAELSALQYQINPHLLFNTLNSIQWKARLAGDRDVPRMLYHLTAMLQNNLNITEPLVTIRKELETIEHFLEIQRSRFGAVFTCETKIEEGLEDGLIPRMSLQPLFENIFFHAFTDGAGRIQLEIARDGEDWVRLELEDDGAGFPAASWSGDGRLPSGAQEDRQGGTQEGGHDQHVARRGGLGLANVAGRFKLHFGESCEFQLHSEPGRGSKVTIRWPLRKEDGHGQADQRPDRG